MKPRFGWRKRFDVLGEFCFGFFHWTTYSKIFNWAKVISKRSRFQRFHFHFWLSGFSQGLQQLRWGLMRGFKIEALSELFLGVNDWLIYFKKIALSELILGDRFVWALSQDSIYSILSLRRLSRSATSWLWGQLQCSAAAFKWEKKWHTSGH